MKKTEIKVLQNNKLLIYYNAYFIVLLCKYIVLWKYTFIYFYF